MFLKSYYNDLASKWWEPREQDIGQHTQWPNVRCKADRFIRQNLRSWKYWDEKYNDNILKNIFTNIIRGPDDLPDLLVFLDDPGHLQVAELYLTIWKLTHQHNILRLETWNEKALNWIKIWGSTSRLI